MIQVEKGIRQKIEKQDNMTFEEFEKYISLINYYSSKKEFPHTLTSMVLHDLMINPQYDDFTILILQKTRHNTPFKKLVMIDNINPYNINTFLENKASEEIIGGDKIKR